MFNEVFYQFANSVGISLVIVLSAIFIQILSTNVSISRGKHKIKAPATTGHEGFERSFRAHLNMIENFVVFLPIFIVAAMNSGADIITKNYPPAIFLIGCTWLLSRIISSVRYIKGWNYRIGIAMFLVSFLCLLSLIFVVSSGMWTYTSELIQVANKIQR